MAKRKREENETKCDEEKRKGRKRGLKSEI